MSRRRLGLVLLPLLLALPGCITIFSKTEVLRGDEQRAPIRFESAKAATEFQGQLQVRQQNNQVSYSHVSVPFITLFERTRTLSDSAFFNEQVHRCDTDQNGLITEQEALVYAGKDCPQEAPPPADAPAPLPRPALGMANAR
jgi:hypothetical protein